MNEEIFKGAIDGITADKSLIDKTYKKMINTPNDRILGSKMILSVSSVFLIVIIGILMINNGYKVEIPKKTAHNSIYSMFPQIEKNYNAFDSKKQYKSYNVKCPSFPTPFNKFIAESDYVILCTIEDIGDYSRKSEPTCLGSRIYIVKIDNILYGQMDEKADNIIPVVEEFFLGCPTQPYSLRPPETRILKTGKQYILYLTKPDETDCYELAGKGFGVFSTDYIEDVIKSTNADDINKLIQKDIRFERYDGTVHRVVTVDANLYYKLYALYTNERFLK